MSSDTTKQIVEEVVKDVVKEVDGKDCLCGLWSLRISLTPKTPAPAKTEASLKEESTASPQNAVVAV